MLSALLVGILVLATEDASQTDEQRREAVSRIAPAKARQLEVASGVDSVRAALVERPLLRWSNPTAGSVFGEVFVWTAAERPVAIASIYRWYHPLKDSTVEVVSVSEQAVAAREGSSVLWQAPAEHRATRES